MSTEERVSLLPRHLRAHGRKGSLLYGTLVGKRNWKQYASCDSLETQLLLQSSIAAACNNRNPQEDAPPPTIQIEQTREGTSIYIKTFRETRKENIWLTLYILLYVGYLCIGSVFFELLESGIEQDMRSSYRSSKAVFLAKYPEVQGKYKQCLWRKSKQNVVLSCFALSTRWGKIRIKFSKEIPFV